MKKLATKLMISVLSVALAFIALGTSTFAWFSMNTEVTASGMELQAATPINLLISNNSSTGFANTATPAAGEVVTGKLLPASSQTGTAFNAIQSNQSVDNTNEGDSLGGVIVSNPSDKNATVKLLLSSQVTQMATDQEGYWAEYNYYLKLTEEVANTYAYLSSLVISAKTTLKTGTVVAANGVVDGVTYYSDAACTTTLEATTLASDTIAYSKAGLTKAARVAVIDVTNSNTLLGIYAVNGANTTYTPLDGSVTVADSLAKDFLGTEITAKDQSSAANRAKGSYFIAAANGTFAAPVKGQDTSTTSYTTAALTKTARNVKLVVWVEGQDDNCINVNGGANLSVVVSFKTIELAS